MRVAAFLCALLYWGAVRAGTSVELCFNYGCAQTAEIEFGDAPLAGVDALLAASVDAAGERDAIARAVGMLYRVAGAQSPIAADRGGNYLDDEVEGRMDCIDHSTDTTRFLALIAARGGLRFHRVLEPARRSWFIAQHFSAAIEEIEPLPRAPQLRAAPAVPDHVPLLLALCACEDVIRDIPRPPEPEALPPGNPGARFVVDSWFVDHGEPAVVLPLADWLNGEGPHVQ